MGSHHSMMGNVAASARNEQTSHPRPDSRPASPQHFPGSANVAVGQGVSEGGAPGPAGPSARAGFSLTSGPASLRVPVSLGRGHKRNLDELEPEERQKILAQREKDKLRHRRRRAALDEAKQKEEVPSSPPPFLPGPPPSLPLFLPPSLSPSLPPRPSTFLPPCIHSHQYHFPFSAGRRCRTDG